MMDTAGSEAFEEEDASIVYDPFYRVRKGGPKEARLFRVALMGEFNSIKVCRAVTCTNNLCLNPRSLSPSHSLSLSLSLFFFRLLPHSPSSPSSIAQPVYWIKVDQKEGDDLLSNDLIREIFEPYGVILKCYRPENKDTSEPRPFTLVRGRMCHSFH